MTNQITIDNKVIPEPKEYSIPVISLTVTTYELAEEPAGRYFWKSTVTHTFYGETVERAYQISDAHKRTDAFYAGSFQGKWNGIILKNSEFQIVQS